MSAVRPLDPTPANVAAVRATLAAAFVDDPMLQWIFPHAVQQAQATAAWLGLFVEAFADGGVVDLVDADAVSSASASADAVNSASARAGADERTTACAVALWRVDEGSLAFSSLPSVGGLLAAFLGVERATQVGNGLRAFADHKPQPPFHYLQFLAVSPADQGHGLGRALVAHGQQRAAAAGVGVYLESTNPRNLPFYGSCGFQRLGEFELLPDGPPAFRLWWQP